MIDSKTVVRQVRYAPAEWLRVKKKAAELGIPAGRLIHIATMVFMGDRTELDRMQALAGTLEGVKPLDR